MTSVQTVRAGKLYLVDKKTLFKTNLCIFVFHAFQTCFTYQMKSLLKKQAVSKKKGWTNQRYFPYVKKYPGLFAY
jgi:hypothetical protein